MTSCCVEIYFQDVIDLCVAALAWETEALTVLALSWKTVWVLQDFDRRRKTLRGGCVEQSWGVCLRLGPFMCVFMMA